MLSMGEIKPLCNDEDIVLTSHMRDRMKKRGILYSDFVSAISNGEIIEQYEGDNPFASCLILGNTADSRPLHAVVSVGGGVLWGITAYYPSPDKWEDGFRIRKAAGKQ